MPHPVPWPQAPEVLAGHGVSTASDCFSFGTVMWEVLTWRLPWAGVSPFAVRCCQALEAWLGACRCTAVVHWIGAGTHTVPLAKPGNGCLLPGRQVAELSVYIFHQCPAF